MNSQELEDEPERTVETQWGSLLQAHTPEMKQENLPLEETMTVSDVFTDEECIKLIAAAEEHGFGFTNYHKAYRGNLRLIITDESLSCLVWERLKAFVPEVVTLRGEEWGVIGLNECWRLAKYYPGDQFMVHCDACYMRNNDEISMFTVNIYMNGGFDGGRTRFYSMNSNDIVHSVVPEAGLCLLFRQPPEKALRHDGERLASGVKYLFRSDVMYRRIQL